MARVLGLRVMARVLALAAGVLSLPILAELRVAPPVRPLTHKWRRVPVTPRGSTLLGISFRTPQVEAFKLDARSTLEDLLAFEFQIIRLGAYWQRIEPAPGQFSTDELDRQVDAAESAGKQIILCVGALKTFGYPEFFVPPHRLKQPLPEGRLIRPGEFPDLRDAATEFIERIVERYRDRSGIVAWQVEHEAVDPLGLEHSWRLSKEWVQREIAAARRADPTRPIVLNAYLPTSLVVGLQQWWRTRDQGDSLAFARQHADIVGLDIYPRHGLISLGPVSTYLDGFSGPWERALRRRLFHQIPEIGRRIMVTEGQAEPWEAVTIPPDPRGATLFSCPPDQLIATYNRCVREAGTGAGGLHAYLFWGAEYWVMRKRSGDASYLDAFARIIRES